MVAILARYASRFSVRALDLTVDSSILRVGAAPTGDDVPGNDGPTSGLPTSRALNVFGQD